MNAGPDAGSPVLVGRAGELAGLAEFLAEAARDGAALLLTGDPGAGKTALLAATAEPAAARGVRVIRGSGVEYETEISFAGLHQLVGALSAELARLPDSSRSALEVALGFGTGPAPAEMAVLHAAYALFVEAARERPLLLVVDDLHALDRASRSVISFVARRTAGRRIGVLAAVRTGVVDSPEPLRLPEMPVGPLLDADAIRLLSSRFAGLPRRLIVDVAHQAQGNPLALLEFGALADGPGTRLRGHTSIGTGPAEEVRALYAARVARLPGGTRELLLLAALEGTGDIGVLEAAAGDVAIGALDAAERDQMIHVTPDGRTVRFRHPLTRSAVVGEATLEQRRSAHRRLAEALTGQPERRADHLSMATAAPDEPVAQIVEAGAWQSLRRGDVLGALTRLRRAAELSPDREKGRRRLADAAYVGASVAGHLDLSHELMRELDDHTATSRSLPAVAAAGYLALMTDGDAATAHRVLVEALDQHTHTAGVGLEDLTPALFTLMVTCQYSGRPERWAPLRELVGKLPTVPVSSPISLIRILEDPGAVPGELLHDLDEQLARLDQVTDAGIIIRTALAASYLDRLSGCRRQVALTLRHARDSGTVSGHPLLIVSALDDLYTGRWGRADAAAREIIDSGRYTRYRLFSQIGRYIAALVAAHRGDVDTCMTHCQVLLDWAAGRDLGRLANWAHQAQARAALGSSDFDTAFRHASAITAPGELPPFTIEALWTALDLVEAAVHSGRTSEAQKHAAALRAARVGRVSPRYALMTATATAMTSAPSWMARQFDEALALPGIEQWPFEVARTHLAYGEQLRRRSLRAEARVHLFAAHERFEWLGAAPWVARAASELRATGMTRSAGALAGDALTPQEREVAELAATGLSTKEVAARLMISPRTVSAHLYRVFPKLGISSRAALRDALTDRDADPEA
ncbi:helix-turn-helix transcriptional regulator [Plantactinospora soyae]|uniref:DNA-binding CsgD family transcriptional regulator n=1 Tax=Plantactinospora soyae TaxID=1544732 RepID=A0A927M9X6_9ACTN|nr:LuxR family transcriptional regulator [Plantactinospora soyae]MBE1489261.1 DNA-binding CsgD family transcriptional regulator [Plantactinospora soyae]